MVTDYRGQLPVTVQETLFVVKIDVVHVAERDPGIIGVETGDGLREFFGSAHVHVEKPDVEMRQTVAKIRYQVGESQRVNGVGLDESVSRDKQEFFLRFHGRMDGFVKEFSGSFQKS